jgi:hypothetical protein
VRSRSGLGIPDVIAKPSQARYATYTSVGSKPFKGNTRNFLNRKNRKLGKIINAYVDYRIKETAY